MAFDGCFLHKIETELKSACECHIDKIYQPSRDELVFLLRKKGFVKRLLITVKPGTARIHFTENKYENPQVPPMFCMLIRKYLSAGRLVDVFQPGLERVLELIFSSSNEMGDIVNLRLVCEFIGNQANIILVNENGIIIDSLRHSDIETCSRLIQPGAVYEYPESQNKLNPLTVGIDEIVNTVIDKNQELSKALLNTVSGFSPIICREIEYACITQPNIFEIDINKFKTALSKVINSIEFENTPILLKDNNSAPFDFTYTDINQYGNGFTKQTFECFSHLLDEFYTSRENIMRIRHSAHDIIKLVNNLRSRTEKKLALRLLDLKKCENREDLRIYGELLKANLYSIKNGSSSAEVQNYYDDNLNTVKIPLNPALSPAKNAEKYFKDYKKTYTAEKTLTELTNADKEELIYFDSVLDSISRSSTIAEIKEIREELSEAGYIKSNDKQRKKSTAPTSYKEYTSSEGFRILVGKNNKQNDYITTNLAAKNDLWFHVKNIPGSHVVVFCHGEEVSDETILFSAQLAASNSKASSSSQVPVDYTFIKNVKKPNGAKPGMVIYTTNKTVYITPEKDLV